MICMHAYDACMHIMNARMHNMHACMRLRAPTQTGEPANELLADVESQVSGPTHEAPAILEPPIE